MWPTESVSIDNRCLLQFCASWRAPAPRRTNAGAGRNEVMEESGGVEVACVVWIVEREFLWLLFWVIHEVPNGPHATKQLKT